MFIFIIVLSCHIYSVIYYYSSKHGRVFFVSKTPGFVSKNPVLNYRKVKCLLSHVLQFMYRVNNKIKIVVHQNRVFFVSHLFHHFFVIKVTQIWLENVMVTILALK